MIIIGFMGSGKTTIAKHLQDHMFKEVIDLDDEIKVLAGKSIKEIFADDGEESFRKLEYKALTKYLSEDVIISTGGGIISYDQSYKLLNSQKQHKIFFLNAPFDNLYDRIQNDTNRPLGNQSRQKVLDLYLSRLDRYKGIADYEISTEETIESSVYEILSYID